MALEFAKELLGDAYTGELEEKLEAKINELYAPKADLAIAQPYRKATHTCSARRQWNPRPHPAPGPLLCRARQKYTADEIAMRKAADLPVD